MFIWFKKEIESLPDTTMGVGSIVLIERGVEGGFATWLAIPCNVYEACIEKKIFQICS